MSELGLFLILVAPHLVVFGPLLAVLFLLVKKMHQKQVLLGGERTFKAVKYLTGMMLIALIAPLILAIIGYEETSPEQEYVLDVIFYGLMSISIIMVVLVVMALIRLAKKGSNS